MVVFQYFLSVVPTTYRSFSTGHEIHTNQYAITEKVGETGFRRTAQPPGLFFKYDIEPVHLTITDRRLPFSQFLVRSINVLGGLVVCTSWIYKGSEAFLTKVFGKKYKSVDDSKLNLLDEKQDVL